MAISHFLQIKHSCSWLVHPVWPFPSLQCTANSIVLLIRLCETVWIPALCLLHVQINVFVVVSNLQLGESTGRGHNLGFCHLLKLATSMKGVVPSLVHDSSWSFLPSPPQSSDDLGVLKNGAAWQIQCIRFWHEQTDSAISTSWFVCHHEQGLPHRVQHLFPVSQFMVVIYGNPVVWINYGGKQQSGRPVHSLCHCYNPYLALLGRS